MEIETVLKAEIVKKYRTLGRRRIVAGYAAIISDLIGQGSTPREAAEVPYKDTSPPGRFQHRQSRISAETNSGLGRRKTLKTFARNYQALQMAENVGGVH